MRIPSRPWTVTNTDLTTQGSTSRQQLQSFKLSAGYAIGYRSKSLLSPGLDRRARGLSICVLHVLALCPVALFCEPMRGRN